MGVSPLERDLTYDFGLLDRGIEERSHIVQNDCEIRVYTQRLG